MGDGDVHKYRQQNQRVSSGQERIMSMRIIHASASMFRLGGDGFDEGGDNEFDDNSDNGEDDFVRHHAYVPFVTLAPKLPASAVAITGLKQRYHYNPPVEKSRASSDGVNVDDLTKDGGEKSVSFASSQSVDDGGIDLGTGYLQSIVNQMGGGTRKQPSDGERDKKPSFIFDPRASREAGLNRYCDFLHGKGINRDKVEEFNISSSIRGDKKLLEVETKSAMKKT